MRRLIIVFMATAFGSSALAADAPSASDLRLALAQRGAKTVVAELLNQDQWDSVSDQIASGRQEWLALVPQLATGADAGPAEDLGIDLATALPKNPAAVLSIANEIAWKDAGIIGLERVCGIPFVEDTQPKSYEQRAVRAVRSVSDPTLERKKRECLAYLRNASRQVR